MEPDSYIVSMNKIQKIEPIFEDFLYNDPNVVLLQTLILRKRQTLKQTFYYEYTQRKYAQSIIRCMARQNRLLRRSGLYPKYYSSYFMSLNSLDNSSVTSSDSD